MLLRIIAALVLAALAAMAFMLLYEIIICPVKPGRGESLEAVLRVRGSAPGLENTLRGLLWLQGSGRVRMRIILLDEGMDEDTRQVAGLLCRENSSVIMLRGKGAPADAISAAEKYGR